MHDRAPTYDSWGTCDECGFQGIVRYACRVDENYDDADALGYMMDSTCPACGCCAAVLILVEAYEEMRFMARHLEASRRK